MENDNNETSQSENKNSGEEMFSNKRLGKLVGDVDDLSDDEKKEVFKIFDKYQVKYTENNNGIYIIISQIKPSILLEVENFLDFCKKNRETLESKDNEQMNTKEKFFGKNDVTSDVENNFNQASPENKYTEKITYQKELDKYGLNLKDDDEEAEVNIQTAKPKISGIKARIIKTGNKPKSTA